MAIMHPFGQAILGRDNGLNLFILNILSEIININ